LFCGAMASCVDTTCQGTCAGDAGACP
jgi:hypothetical protein